MSNFQGTWRYGKNMAMGKEVVPAMGAIIVKDDENGAPATIEFPGLALGVSGKGDYDISFKKDQEHRGRLVILSPSANSPAILIGSIARGNYTDEDPHGPIGDADIDVFIAVKVG